LPRAAKIAATPSASVVEGNTGGPSGNPFRLAKPLIASATVPKPGRSRIGPVCPKPLMRSRERLAPAASSSAGPIFQRSSVPGRKFSIRTSKSLISDRNIARPRGDERLRVMLVLPR